LEIYLLCELRTIFCDVRWRSSVSGVECDILIPDLQVGIEIDGEYWHRRKLKKDRSKTQFLASKGLHVIRVRQKGLPLIDGAIVEYRQNDDLQEVTLRLVAVIRNQFASKELDTYLAEGVQRNATAYREVMARLPAPPPGETLKDLYPDVACEWDYEANAPLIPELFASGSDQRFAWKCRKGHQWYSTIKNRTRNQSGCPLCYDSDRSAILRRGRAKKTVSVAQSSSACVSIFDTDKNGFPPSEVAAKSGVKVWWRCDHGHSFQRAPREMEKSSYCPVCESLPVAFPNIAGQWDYEKNGDKKPEDYSWGSGERVWWKCRKGHTWQTVIVQRTKIGSGCPQCYNERRGRLRQKEAVKKNGSLAEINPTYLTEWDYTKNVDILPDSLPIKSSRKVWWVCPENHSYIQSIASKARGSICPDCAKAKRAETVRRAKLARTGSLADNHPDIAKHWHQKRNGNVSPSDISSSSHQVVWWCCDKGHEWQECPNRITAQRRPMGCPICRSNGKQRKVRHANKTTVGRSRSKSKN
jgi:hypothetical protein